MKIPFKSSEVVILLTASVMSLLANLPDTILGGLVDRKVLIASLAAVVVVAMFRYLQMLLLCAIAVLAIGANLPAELASELEISQLALLVSLAILVTITLVNRAAGWLPTGAETPEEKITNARLALLAAIAKGDVPSIERMLAMNPDVNFTQDGVIPLHLAAEKGHTDIVKLLVDYGALFYVKNAEGKTSLDLEFT
jgi:hypothetical protein